MRDQALYELASPRLADRLFADMPGPNDRELTQLLRAR